jgi:hypothetical protein
MPPSKGNPDCTQAFTYPFVMALRDDQGRSYQALQNLETGMPRAEHRRSFGMEGFAMFDRRSLFNYRRIVSQSTAPAQTALSMPGEMTLVNWNQGNDWILVDDPLILTDGAIDAAGQRQNWMGGLSVKALMNAENHALRFAEWLMDTQARPELGLPLSFLSGVESPLGTQSGLSMVPYIREGRRIIGRPCLRPIRVHDPRGRLASGHPRKGETFEPRRWGWPTMTSTSTAAAIATGGPPLRPAGPAPKSIASTRYRYP